MEKKNRFCRFTFNKRSILVLLILYILFGTIIVAISDQKGVGEGKAESAFKVKIPDGLYMYKPDFSKDAISPLVLVKDGKLHDPYTLAKKMGMPSFTKAYITNKTFYAYVGSELYGKVSDLNLISDYGCITDEFVPYIRWVGRYNGKPLPHGWLTERVSDAGIRYRVFGSTKVIFAPQELRVRKNNVAFQVTETDMEKMIGALQKNVIPSALEDINRRLEKDRKVIGVEEGRLYATEAFDLDGNGKKDLLGVYYLVAKQGSLKSVSTQNIFFVLWDSGRIERIASENMTPAYVIGGIIDLDLDGVQELILGTSVGPNREDGDEGLQIDILRYGPPGWRSVYRPKWICGPSCSDVYNFRDYGRR